MNKAIKKYNRAKYKSTRLYYGNWTIKILAARFDNVEITLAKREGL
ncbi:MAG: hypothetical protein ACJASL_003865 [Paraglaciecola sp.]|jgi:hypothetical protein